MFEIDGDWFAVSAIACVQVIEDCTVEVTLYAVNDPVEYEFDDEESAKSFVARFVAAWKEAL